MVGTVLVRPIPRNLWSNEAFPTLHVVNGAAHAGNSASTQDCAQRGSKAHMLRQSSLKPDSNALLINVDSETQCITRGSSFSGTRLAKRGILSC